MRSKLTRALRGGCLATALLGAPLTGATTFSTNYSDLWWVPTESGWGLNVAQQADVMFVTLFVYGPQGQPVWYSATLAFESDGLNGNKTWSGDLYQTTGPFYEAPFDPSQVTLHKVGVASFASNSTNEAVFRYVTGTTFVTKDIVRQTLVDDDLSGTYLGATSDVSTGCINPANNGIRTEDPGTITISQTGTAVTIQAPSCKFTGTYAQAGQMGTIAASYTCTNTAHGSITFYEMRVEQSGITGRYTGHDSSCSFFGNIGALRKP
jgi:hypothetical protein